MNVELQKHHILHMKLKTWFRYLSFSVAFVLLQIPFRKFNDIDTDEEFLKGNTFLLIAILFSKLMNNTLMFFTVQLRMFKKIFVDYDVASLDNFNILTDIFDYGYEMQDHFWNIIYVIVGKST